MGLLDTLLSRAGPQFSDGNFQIRFMVNPLTFAVQGIDYVNNGGSAHLILYDRGSIALEQDLAANTSDKYLVINLGSIDLNGILSTNVSDQITWESK